MHCSILVLKVQGEAAVPQRVDASVSEYLRPSMSWLSIKSFRVESFDLGISLIWDNGFGLVQRSPPFSFLSHALTKNCIDHIVSDAPDSLMVAGVVFLDPARDSVTKATL